MTGPGSNRPSDPRPWAAGFVTSRPQDVSETISQGNKLRCGVEHLLRSMDKAAEALMVQMEKRFEKICLEVVHKSDAERRKNTEVDIVKYKERMEQIMLTYIEKIHDYVQNTAKERKPHKAKGFLDTVFSRDPVVQDSEDSNDESGDSTDSAKHRSSAASAAKKKSSTVKRKSPVTNKKSKIQAEGSDSAEDETAALKASEQAAKALKAAEHEAKALKARDPAVLAKLDAVAGRVLNA